MAEYNLAAGLTVDGAYYFTPVIGVFDELGYDVAYFKSVYPLSRARNPEDIRNAAEFQILL